MCLTGCIGPISLHKSVMSYDETISRLEMEMLLLNIARTHTNLPHHFTFTSNIAATFAYQANAGFTGAFNEIAPGVHTYGVSLGASSLENPTLNIVPMMGEEFTKLALNLLIPLTKASIPYRPFEVTTQNGPLSHQPSPLRRSPFMALTKDDIIGSLQSGLGLSRSESSRCLDTVLELIKSSLAGDGDVLISGFGKFMVRQKAARRGRNPATGGRLTLRRRKVVKFRCSPVLREKIHGTPA
jgi:integration host factor subunit alpha